jgi:hypothetical protein
MKSLDGFALAGAGMGAAGVVAPLLEFKLSLNSLTLPELPTLEAAAAGA